MSPHRHVEFLDQGVSILGHQPTPERYSVYEVAKAYRLRWQVELLFKEWKSYANLHAFDTQNPAIVEGLIWAAISATALKRFLAHTAQVVAGVETSTRKVAMCAVHFLHDILRALISEIENRFVDTFARAIDYLAGNAKRAHPKRDRQRGRLQFGLEPISRILNYITYEGSSVIRTTGQPRPRTPSTSCASTRGWFCQRPPMFAC